MFCRQCGKKISDGSKFCMYCGKQVISYTEALKPAVNTFSGTVSASSAASAGSPANVPSSVPKTVPDTDKRASGSGSLKIFLIIGGVAVFAAFLVVIITVVGLIGSNIFSSNDRRTADNGNDNSDAGQYYVYEDPDSYGYDIGGNDYGGNDVNSNQHTICVSCHGSGMCPVCDGTGTYRNYGQSSDCSACGGTGICSICGGSGYTS